MAETRFVLPSLNAALDQARSLNPVAPKQRKHSGRKSKADGIKGIKMEGDRKITVCHAKQGRGKSVWTPRFVVRFNGPVGSKIAMHETNDGRFVGGMPAQWEGEPTSSLTRRQRMAKRAIERQYWAEVRERRKWDQIADRRHFQLHGLTNADKAIARHVVRQTESRLRFAPSGK